MDIQDALFPAWAGVILAADDDVIGDEAIPRMGGGDPDARECAAIHTPYSPHGRG